MAVLKRDVDASNELYEQVVKRLRTGDVMAGISGSDVTVIDPAAVPTRRAEPHRFLNLVGGITIGALCGVALCGLLETTDRKISTTNAVAELCPLPGVGMIPKFSNDNSTKLLPIAALDLPDSQAAEAYRSLRTALLHQGPGEPAKVILVTGPSADEGKTVSSINLAIVFAQMNRRVLLVDTDFRKKTLSRYFSAAAGGGLSAALTGGSPSSYFLSPAGMPNLTVLPAGEESAIPPDVIDSSRMRELVAKWREEYDQVILDATHVLGLSDAVVLSTMADTTVLIVRAGYGRRQDVLRVLEVLDGVGAKVSGAVVTDAMNYEWRMDRSREVSYAPA
jgi:capsular exopolysaccharide synthesis family protein